MSIYDFVTSNHWCKEHTFALFALTELRYSGQPTTHGIQYNNKHNVLSRSTKIHYAVSVESQQQRNHSYGLVI